MLNSLLVVALTACSSGAEDNEGGAGPVLVAGPEVLVPLPEASVPLARELTVSTDVPTTLQLNIDDGDRVLRVAFPEEATVHRVPVLGMPATPIPMPRTPIPPSVGWSGSGSTLRR